MLNELYILKQVEWRAFIGILQMYVFLVLCWGFGSGVIYKLETFVHNHKPHAKTHALTHFVFSLCVCVSVCGIKNKPNFAQYQCVLVSEERWAGNWNIFVQNGFLLRTCVCVSGVFLYAPLIFLLIQSCVGGGRIVARYVFSCAWCVISMLLAFLCQNIFIV